MNTSGQIITNHIKQQIMKYTLLVNCIQQIKIENKFYPKQIIANYWKHNLRKLKNDKLLLQLNNSVFVC